MTMGQLDSGKARGHLDLVHLRPSSTSPSQQPFKIRADSSMHLQLMVQQRMLQQKRNMYHRHRGGVSPTPLSNVGDSAVSSASSSSLSRRNIAGDHVPRQDSYKLAQRKQILPPLSQVQDDNDTDEFEREREREEERWKSLPSRLATDCQLAERTMLWSQQVTP